MTVDYLEDPAGTIDMQESVVVTAVAARLDDLAANAYEQARTAFQAYGSGTDWKTAGGRQLVAMRISDVTPRSWRPGEPSNSRWQAKFRVGARVGS